MTKNYELRTINMENNLYTKYKKEIAPALKQEFGYNNVMQVPKIEKVIINVGVGRFVKDAEYVKNVEATIRKITGQNPVKNKAKKAISNFKIREGMEVGISVTLRGKKMYDFLEKLLNISFPRIRDFRGISDKGFDKQGNFSYGFRENLSFPEIKADEIDKMHGLEIVIVNSAKNSKEGKALLKYFGFPFNEKTNKLNK